MPATFAHCILCQEAIGGLEDSVREKSPLLRKLASLVSQNNQFAITGAAGPDYPYLNDVLTTGILHVGHTWADRMHYENVDLFVVKAIERLTQMDYESDDFGACLSWTLGFLSHVLADVYLHPVINAIVGGIYHFTSSDHGHCELVQDMFIFHNKTGEEIVDANPNSGIFAYLSILDMSSDSSDTNRLHPAVSSFWREALKDAHPEAAAYFDSIEPDTWHKKYKSRVDFAVNPGPIARHGMQAIDKAYGRYSKMPAEDIRRFVTEIKLPNGETGTYQEQFNKTIDNVIVIWMKTLQCVADKKPFVISDTIKTWNLDTGVDEEKIYFWPK
jgi:hypothetical protein